MGTTLSKLPPTLLHTDSATGDLSALIRDVPCVPVTELLITTKFTAIHCNCSWEPPLLLRIHYHDANGHHRTNYHWCMGTTLPKIPPTLLHTDDHNVAAYTVSVGAQRACDWNVLRMRLGVFLVRFFVRMNCALLQKCLVAPYGSAGTQLSHCTVRVQCRTRISHVHLMQKR